MSKYRLVYLPSAQEDLVQLFDYIKSDNPPAAHKFLKKFDTILKRLSRFPKSGPLLRDPYLKRKKYRAVVIGDYLAFYKIRGSVIQVHRVLHGKRTYSFLL